MRFQTLTLVLLGTPCLLQAGPVASDELLNNHPSVLKGRSTEAFSEALVTRADDGDPEVKCTDWASCKDEGRKYWDKMKEQLDSDEPNEVRQYDGVLKRDYEDEVTRDCTPEDAAFRKAFEDRNLDFHKHFATHDIKSIGGKLYSYQNMYNTNLMKLEA
ncbi:MAG: hypothetical protein Q9221_008597 [Calogaya cf. arnoldii]